MNKLPVLTFCLGALLFSCIPLPDGPGRRVTEKPEISDLVGKYSIINDSLKFLRKSGFDQSHSDPKNVIILNADRSCIFEGWSTYNNLSSKEDRKKIQAQGTWKFSSEKYIVSYVVIDLDLKFIQGEQVRRSFRLAKINGEYVLWDWASDPDERNYCIFKRS
jgi:hypothetical protein